MPITKDQKEQLALALAEARARKLRVLVPQSRDSHLKKDVWPVDDNGYFIKQDGTHYRPTEAQSGFIHSNARFVGMGGSRGCGKTGAGSQKALRKIMQGQSGAVLNPDFQNFVDSTWPEFRSWIPWDMVVPSQRMRQNPDWIPHKPFQMVFTNGAIVICKGLKDPDAARGPNINWLWYDEGSRDLDGMSWKLAVASVRIGTEPQAWTTYTPRGFDHWTYKLFVKQDISEEAKALFEAEGRPIVDYYHGSISDNKANLDPGYYASLLAAYSNGWLRQQEIEGEYVEAGGILGNAGWFREHILTEMPEGIILKGMVRYWDLAATEKKITGKKKGDDPDETVGTLMGWDGLNFYIMHQISGQWSYDQIKANIALTAKGDGQLVPIYIEQEPGSGGKNQVADIAAMPELMGYSVRPHIPEGDKVLRANIWFAEAQAGRFFLLAGAWTDHFLSQLSSFPVARHDDTIDGVSGARLCIAPIRKWKNVRFLSI